MYNYLENHSQQKLGLMRCPLKLNFLKLCTNLIFIALSVIMCTCYSILSNYAFIYSAYSYCLSNLLVPVIVLLPSHCYSAYVLHN